MGKIIFVTGATSGFGRAIAELFAKNDYSVIINGRRKDRLQSIEKKLKEKYGVNVISLPFDVRNREDVEAAIRSLPDDWKDIDVLVNNAGLALGLSDIQDGNTDDWDTMIDTNVKGLLYVTRQVAPGMIKRKRGHIVNISSIAGKEVYPKGNVYCASKHAADALGKAMRIDMHPHHIKVTNINPGLAETEFSIVRFKGDEDKAEQVYKGIVPLYADDVADAVWYAVSRPEHVQIAEITLLPAAQASSRDVRRSE